jgi:hypothetical protein
MSACDPAALQDAKVTLGNISGLLCNKKLRVEDLNDAIQSLTRLQEAIKRGDFAHSNFAASDKNEAWISFRRQLRVLKRKALTTKRNYREWLPSRCPPIPTASEIGMNESIARMKATYI